MNPDSLSPRLQTLVHNTRAVLEHAVREYGDVVYSNSLGAEILRHSQDRLSAVFVPIVIILALFKVVSAYHLLDSLPTLIVTPMALPMAMPSWPSPLCVQVPVVSSKCRRRGASERQVYRSMDGGATWGDLDRETQLFGLAVPGGVVSTTFVTVSYWLPSE